MTTLTAERYAGRRTGAMETLVVARDVNGRDWPLPYIGRAGEATPPEAHRFDWGRIGTGPDRLARSLLIDALGEAAACDECHGTGKIVYDPDEERDIPYDEIDPGEVDPLDVGECICEDGRRPLPVEEFVRERISRLDPEEDWWLTRREILAWLAGRYAEPPDWITQGTVDVNTGGLT